MAAAATPARALLAAAMERERPRLVRLCAAITGASHAAEDLAQEALLQAWSHADRLSQPSDAAGLARWLDAYARHMCLRWQRAQGRAHARLISLDLPTDAPDDLPSAGANALLAVDQLDPADAYERAELERLLERALATLPPLTRDLLARHYLAEMPHAALAAELRLSEDAVAQRLHRGRLALRQALAGALREEAAAFGLPLAGEDTPRETRIWCPLCGARRLHMYRSPATGRYGFFCPACARDVSLGLTGPSAIRPDDGAPLTSPKAILSRQLLWLSAYYHTGLARRTVACGDCGRQAVLSPRLSDDLPADVRAALPSEHGITVRCPTCGIVDSTPLTHLALDLPEAVSFWRAHPRIRHLPEREVEAEGQAAIVTTYASVAGGAQLHVVTARDTLRVLQVHAVNGTAGL